MKKLKPDYRRHYMNLKLRRNDSETPKSPDYIRHNITSSVLKEHLRYCLQQDLPLTFDVSAFCDYTDDSAVITLSVPYELKYKRRVTTLFDAEEYHE